MSRPPANWPEAVVSIVLISCVMSLAITVTALTLYHRRRMAGLPPFEFRSWSH